MRRACQQACSWQKLYPQDELAMSVNVSAHQVHSSVAAAPMSINVNLSPRQLGHPQLVDDVAAVLKETGLEPSRLVLEITGGAAMEAALKAWGVRLAIDDFGTGYSNSSYLKVFPRDVLKIDRRFVSGLSQSSSDTEILHSIIDLAHALKLRVIAEGAGTLEEVEQLRAGIRCRARLLLRATNARWRF